MVISVLLVDDHKIVREGTRQLLIQSEDIQVIGEAADGREALTLVEEHKPDVVVMDVRLPKLNGIEATRIITRQFPAIKVLILSAYDDDSYIFPLFDAGASGYLLKTASGKELEEAIRKVHQGEIMFSPHIGTKLVKRFHKGQRYQQKGMSRGLTAREMDVLRAVANGAANKMIAGELGISVQTVQVHLRNIFSKLQVSSRSEAISLAIRYGWISLERDDES
jgi:DNA-binding NarL/FixJ family response regulator